MGSICGAWRTPGLLFLMSIQVILSSERGSPKPFLPLSPRRKGWNTARDNEATEAGLCQGSAQRRVCGGATVHFTQNCG